MYNIIMFSGFDVKKGDHGWVFIFKVECNTGVCLVGWISVCWLECVMK
jgi:hypothetical protein